MKTKKQEPKGRTLVKREPSRPVIQKEERKRENPKDEMRWYR
jgi:hypothetical protein